MTPTDSYDIDPQDQAEVYDEDNYDGDNGSDMMTLEEMPDVFDVTRAVGDSDDDDARIGEELDDDDIVELQADEALADLEDDELAARDAEVYGEQDEQTDEFETEDDYGEADANTAAADEAEIEFTGDVDGVTDPDDDDAEAYEAGQVSDEDLREMGYQPPRAEAKDDEDQSQATGPSAEDVAEECDPHQDELLDEGVEETFPASDPVSVKRIT
jgi:hypothetical protein